MHYHWNLNLYYHEMLSAFQIPTNQENRRYSDISDKPLVKPENLVPKAIALKDSSAAIKDNASNH